MPQNLVWGLALSNVEEVRRRGSTCAVKSRGSGGSAPGRKFSQGCRRAASPNTNGQQCRVDAPTLVSTHTAQPYRIGRRAFFPRRRTFFPHRRTQQYRSTHTIIQVDTHNNTGRRTFFPGRRTQKCRSRTFFLC